MSLTSPSLTVSMLLAKSSVAPDATLKVPVSIWVAAAALRLKVPDSTSTVPELFRVVLRSSALDPLSVNVPVFDKLPGPLIVAPVQTSLPERVNRPFVVRLLLRVSVPLIVELAATVNPPPEMTSGSSAVILFTDSTFSTKS